jgi:hypothetical protein
MYEYLQDFWPENEMVKTLVRTCRDDLAKAKEAERRKDGERR